VDAFHEAVPVDGVDAGEVLADCLQFHGFAGDHCGVSVDVVEDIHSWFLLDGLEQFLELSFEAHAVVGVDLQSAAFYYVDSFPAECLKRLLVGHQDLLYESLRHLNLKVLGPVADEEETALYDVESVLVHQG
jgi:hypothetical protein